MPFCHSFSSYYPAIFKPALEAVGYIVTRADDLFTPRPIMLDIQDSILAADLILCEMSGRNPNVFYELGLAHAIGKPAILISRKKDDIPFDLRHVRVILYDPTEAGWESKLQEEIGLAAQAVVTSSEIWPPPLIDVSPTPPQEFAGCVNNQVVSDSQLAGVLRTSMSEDLENVHDKEESAKLAADSEKRATVWREPARRGEAPGRGATEAAGSTVLAHH